MTFETFMHGMSKFLTKEVKDFGTSFKPEFYPFTVNPTTTRTSLFIPQPRPIELSWIGFTVRSMGDASQIYVGPLHSDGKMLSTVDSYYERGTDHRPLIAEHYYIWTTGGTGTAEVEIDGEFW